MIIGLTPCVSKLAWSGIFGYLVFFSALSRAHAAGNPPSHSVGTFTAPFDIDDILCSYIGFGCVPNDLGGPKDTNVLSKQLNHILGPLEVELTFVKSIVQDLNQHKLLGNLSGVSVIASVHVHYSDYNSYTLAKSELTFTWNRLLYGQGVTLAMKSHPFGATRLISPTISTRCGRMDGIR